MRAFAVTAFGSPGSVIDRPIPTPGDGEILVRVRAAGVNVFDLVLLTGSMQAFMEHRLPLTPGLDYAGTVEALGPGVEGLVVGDEVFGSVGKSWFGEGTWAEHVTASAGLAQRRPEGLGAAEAAALPTSGGVAIAELDALHVVADDTIVVVGAAGGVGNFLTQLASQAGVHVVAVTGHESAAFVRDLGAVDVIDYASTDVVSEIRQRYPAGVAGIADNFHDAAGLAPYPAAVRPGGRIVSAVARGLEEALAGQPVTGHMVRSEMHRAGELGLLVVAAGSLRVPVRTFPLEDALQAVAAQSGRQVRGKIVLVVE